MTLRRDGRRMRDQFAQPGAVDKSLEEVAQYWSARRGNFSMKTPDAALNSMGNIWNQVQCHTTFNWSRSASFNEAGGRDGLGFRDSCQDVLGVLHVIPDQVKAKLSRLASCAAFFRRGHAPCSAADLEPG